MLPYVNPLTGEGCAQDIAQKRPVAVMLNNLKRPCPSWGVPGRHHLMRPLPRGHHPDAGGVPVGGGGGEHWVGALRPGLLCLPWPWGHDALYLHASRGAWGLCRHQELGAAAFDCVNGPYEGTLFWRDKERRKHMGMEHSVLTSGSTISELMPTYSLPPGAQGGLSVPCRLPGGWGEGPGRAGERVSVEFSTYKTGVFTYQPETGLYLVEEYGAPYLDGNTGEQVAVKTCWSCAPTSPVSRGMTQAAFPSALRGLGRDSFSVTGRCRTSPGPRPSTARP